MAAKLLPAGKGRKPEGWDNDRILTAAINGDVNTLVSMSNEGIDVTTACDGFGETVLHEASRNGQHELLQNLLKTGIAIDVRDNDQWTALHWAARFGKNECIQLLLKAGAAVDAKTDDGSTPLHYAADKGHNKAIDILIAAGATVDAKDRDGITPLADAIVGDHAEAVHTLLYKYKAKPSRVKQGKLKHREWLQPWIQSISNHLWWAAQTCNGHAQLLTEKFIVEDKDSGYTYTYNPCYPFTVAEGCTNVAGCQQDSGNDHALGQQTKDEVTYSIIGEDVVITYSGGVGGRSFDVTLKCTQTEKNTFEYNEENPPKDYRFTLFSPCACPGNCIGGGGEEQNNSILKSGGLSNFYLFGIIVLSLYIVSYFVTN